jgi:hypothetical protein
VGLGILSAEVVTIICSDHGQGELMRDLQKPLIHLQLIFHSVVLDLNKKPAAAKNLSIIFGRLKSFLHLPPTGMASDLSFQTPAQSDQTLVIFSEKFFIHPRLIIKSFKLGEAHQLQKIEITRLILDQKGEMIVSLSHSSLSLKSASGRNIDFTSHNGLNAMLDGHLIKFDRAKHIPVIGQRQGIHSIFLG